MTRSDSPENDIFSFSKFDFLEVFLTFAITFQDMELSEKYLAHSSLCMKRIAYLSILLGEPSKYDAR